MSLIRKLFPRTLRSRLILGFGLTIFLSLFLAATATIYLLRAEQEKTAREKVGRLAEPVALREAFLESQGITSPTEIQEILEAFYGVRILIIDRDATVVGDSGKTLRGQIISELAGKGVPARPLGDDRYRVQRFHPPGSSSLLLFTSQTTGLVATIPVPGGTVVPRYQAVIAIDESELSQAWRALLPRLSIAGGIALAVGVVTAGILARSITRPLQQVTLASEQMALGRYDQQIRDYGGDEVGRLTSAFNAMARQVSRSHRTLREFLANVSHELKTPLTSIQGFSQAMVDGSLKTQDDFLEAGKIINQEAVRMRGLVDDLLYLSQVEAGEAVLQLDDVNPNDLLIATRDRFRRRAEQANITLTVDTGPAAVLRADARRIEQAVANLVDNAIRHTPAGGRVHLGSAAANGSIYVSVLNTGSFIPPEATLRIFDRFYQVDPAQARADGNTGLGLAITKEIVEAHDGHVDVRSDRDDGTQFTISLPLAGPSATDKGDTAAHA